MSFLRNDAINRVNLHTGVQALAHGVGNVFILVFLLKAGVSISAVFLAQAGIVAVRFALRPAILPLATRYGLKPLLIFGTVAIGVQYPLLAEVQGVGPMLLAVCIAAAIGEVCYFLAYNTYFSVLGDVEHRGHQIGAREALVAGIGVVTPLLGAWALMNFGARWTFAAVAVVQLLAVAPLIGMPNVPVARHAPGAFKAARSGALLIGIDGWFDACYFFVWQIALFVSLSESLSAYGGAMALAGLVAVVFGLLVGKYVDGGLGRRAVAIAYGTALVIVLLRAGSFGYPWLAVIANAAGAVLMPMLVPPLDAVVCNLAKAAPCPLRFQMAAEGGWDVGCFAACLCAAALTALGVSLGVVILLALPAIVAGGVVLRRFYPAEGLAAAPLSVEAER